MHFIAVFLLWPKSILFSFEKGGIPCVADFVHGSDGMGNICLPPPNAKKVEKSASEFLVDKVSEFPGEVSVLALGPLTNLALVSRDLSCPTASF